MADEPLAVLVEGQADLAVGTVGRGFAVQAEQHRGVAPAVEQHHGLLPGGHHLLEPRHGLRRQGLALVQAGDVGQAHRRQPPAAHAVLKLHPAHGAGQAGVVGLHVRRGRTQHQQPIGGRGPEPGHLLGLVAQPLLLLVGLVVLLVQDNKPRRAQRQKQAGPRAHNRHRPLLAGQPAEYLLAPGRLQRTVVEHDLPGQLLRRRPGQPAGQSHLGRQQHHAAAGLQTAAGQPQVDQRLAAARDPMHQPDGRLGRVQSRKQILQGRSLLPGGLVLHGRWNVLHGVRLGAACVHAQAAQLRQPAQHRGRGAAEDPHQLGARRRAVLENVLQHRDLPAGRGPQRPRRVHAQTVDLVALQPGRLAKRQHAALLEGGAQPAPAPGVEPRDVPAAQTTRQPRLVHLEDRLGSLDPARQHRGQHHGPAGPLPGGQAGDHIQVLGVEQGSAIHGPDHALELYSPGRLGRIVQHHAGAQGLAHGDQHDLPRRHRRPVLGRQIAQLGVRRAKNGDEQAGHGGKRDRLKAEEEVGQRLHFSPASTALPPPCLSPGFQAEG